ncbi:unnamed protein product [Polarella glacialis]|uniref:Uncharacterized protein n=1 Tax=Polarella glacialis TaxID=89957 RepID=A0A813IAL5_POLGL|nr:unnamed protein product [Polarella glacialis]
MTAHDDSRVNSKTATVEEFVSELELYTSEHFRTNQNSLDMTAQSTPPRQLTGKDCDSRFNSKTAHAVGKLDVGCTKPHIHRGHPKLVEAPGNWKNHPSCGEVHMCVSLVLWATGYCDQAKNNAI